MKQTLWMKLKAVVGYYFRKIIGKEYSCCDKYRNCAKCKYVRGEEE